MSASYLGDFPADQAIYFMYNTSDGSGGSITRSADGAVSVYKDNSDGSSYNQTQVTTGVTEDEDVDGLEGVHSVCITTTNAWYETGHDYAVVLSASTIDGETVNAVIATFSIENRPVDVTRISGDSIAADNLESQYDTTGLSGDTFPATQLQLGRIALTGAAVNTPAKDEPNGFVIAWGENEANDEDSTHAADGTYHDIEAQNDGGTQKIDAYYEFDIGGDGLPTSVTWEGYLSKGGGANKNITVEAYNWTTWDRIGSIDSGVSDSVESFTLFTSHVGTGADVGKVRIRFVTGSVSFSATTLLKTDQIFLSYAIVTRTVGYANGEIWVDTSLNNTKTESFVDGTADNPVSTWAAALILSDQLNITHFHIANGSTITLTDNSDNYVLEGHEWTLILDGQSCDDAAFTGAHVTGTCTGVEVIFNDCNLAASGGTLTAAGIEAHNCALAGSIVLTAANTYFFDKCYSAIAGTSTPDLDFGAAVGNQNVNFRHYSGGIEIKNMGRNGTDNMSLEGHGQLILNSNCDPSNSPVIAIRGHFTITDNVAGGFVSGGGTLSDEARFDQTQILDAVIDDSTRIDASQLNTHTVIVPASAASLAAHDTTLDTVAGDVANIDGAPMRGTDSAATASALTTHDNKLAPAALDGGDTTIGGMLSKIADDNGGADFDSTSHSLKAIRDRGDAAWAAAGSGAIEWTYTLTSTVAPNAPIADADVWVTTDAAGSNVIANGKTDQSGIVTFFLDAGTVYVFRQKSGWNFDNPDTEVVS